MIQLLQTAWSFISGKISIIKYGLVGLAIAGSGYLGYSYSSAKWQNKFDEMEKQRLQLLAEVKDLEIKAANVSVKVVTKYVDRYITVTKQGEEIIREIPVYITKESDTKCDIPTGFVLIHNAAATNTKVPQSTREANDSSSGVKISEVAGTVTENYTEYHKLKEQLTALQEWIKEQVKIYNKE